MELRGVGLDFATIPFADWVKKLRESAARVDEAHNPAVKLVEFFENSYEAGNGLEDNNITFETKAGQRDSAALKSAPDIIHDGYIKKYWVKWLPQWT